MTDSHDPSAPDPSSLDAVRKDEIASAFVDGEATPADVAEVDRDPDVRNRVNELRIVRDEIASYDLTAPHAVRAAHLQAAMAAFDAAEGATVTRSEGDDWAATVVSLSDRRTTSGMPRWIAAAAAVVVVAGGVGLAATQLSTSSDDEGATATTAGAALQAADSDAADTGDTEAPATTAAAEALTDRAEGGGDDAMAEEEAAADGDTAFAPEPLRAEPAETALDLYERSENELAPIEDSRCGTDPSVFEIQQTLDPDASEPLGFIPAIVDGESGELFVFADSTGEPMAFVVDEGCELLLE